MNTSTDNMDEVSGRRATSVDTHADHGNENQCAQCVESGQVVSAAGFCKTCTDFLCQACINLHKVLRATKDHELLKDEPKSAPSEYEICPLHPGRSIEVYCRDEDTFGCLHCLRDGHKSCDNLELILDLSRGIETSVEFLEVQKASHRHKSLEDECKRAIEKCRSLIEEWHNKVIKDFQQYRLNILSVIDKLGQEMTREADRVKQENEKLLSDLADSIESYSEKVQSSMLKIEDTIKFKKRKQLFVALKKNGRRVINSVKSIEQLFQDIEIKKFEFRNDNTIYDYVKKSSNIHAESNKLECLLCTKTVDAKKSNTDQQHHHKT